MRKASQKINGAAPLADYRGRVRVKIATRSTGKTEVTFWTEDERQMTTKEAVKCILVTARWTAAELAERLLQKKRSVHNWTLGRPMSVGVAIQLSHVLKTDMQYEGACNEHPELYLQLAESSTPAVGCAGKNKKKGGC